MGGDGGSLEEKAEQAAPPRITPVHVQGDAPNHPTERQWQDPASQRPSSAQAPTQQPSPPLVGAPAFSSPPADQQQQQQEAHAALHAWQRQQQHSGSRGSKASLGPACLSGKRFSLGPRMGLKRDFRRRPGQSKMEPEMEPGTVSGRRRDGTWHGYREAERWNLAPFPLTRARNDKFTADNALAA
jgi:hypothetical protein